MSVHPFITELNSKGHTVVGFDVQAGGHDAMTWMGDIPTAATLIHSPLRRSLYQGSMTRLLMQNNSLFRKLEDKHLEEHRHDDPRIQHKYDKRFGLVLKN